MLVLKFVRIFYDRPSATKFSHLKDISSQICGFWCIKISTFEKIIFAFLNQILL